MVRRREGQGLIDSWPRSSETQHAKGRAVAPSILQVLIVDDHPMIHEVLRAVAQKTFPGVQVHDSYSLDEAIQTAGRLKNLELVLFDLGLPDVDGVEALVRFRARNCQSLLLAPREAHAVLPDLRVVALRQLFKRI